MLAPPGWCNQRSIIAVGCKNAVKAGQVNSGFRHQRNQAGPSGGVIEPAIEEPNNSAKLSADQLRAVNAEGKENCAFIKTITKGAGGGQDASQYAEIAMSSALTQAANDGADSYFVVNADTTSSGATVVVEALRCK